MKNKKDYTKYYREYRRLKQGKPDYQEEDMIKCLICGKSFVFVGSHVRQTHLMYMIDYKKQFGLDTKRGKTTGLFKRLKAKAVFENKTVNNLKKGRKFWFIKGDKKAGRYVRSQETLERLKKLKFTYCNNLPIKRG